MTLQEAQEKVLNVARDEIGYHEGYNNYIKYAVGNWDNQFYGWDLQNQPWCDVFVDYCYTTAFGMQTGAAMTYQKVGAGSALCSASASYYKSNGAFYNYPEPGDQIFFIYNGGINHTGIVETINGKGASWTSLITIEGNTSDQVARREYKKGDITIAGFGRPNWNLVVNNSQSTPIAEDKKEEEQKETIVQPIISNPLLNISKKYHPFIYTVKINLLKEGNQGAQVTSMQSLLKEKGFDCEVTGYFDSKTKLALKTFQKKVKLDDDGEFGGQTFLKLWDY